MARPREFDSEKVLNQITDVFWEKGFKATSIDDLVQSTGLRKGSLYSCFGDKQKLFELALTHYFKNGPLPAQPQRGPMDTLVHYFERIIGDADLPTHRRRGCLIFNSCLEFGNKSEKSAGLVVKFRKAREAFFRRLIKDAQFAGEIPAHVDLKKAGQRVFATAFTIREMSKFMAEKEFLTEIANACLTSLGTERRMHNS